MPMSATPASSAPPLVVIYGSNESGLLTYADANPHAASGKYEDFRCEVG